MRGYQPIQHLVKNLSVTGYRLSVFLGIVSSINKEHLGY